MKDLIAEEFKALLAGSELLRDPTFTQYLALGFDFSPDALSSFVTDHDTQTEAPDHEDAPPRHDDDLAESLLNAVKQTVVDAGCTEARLGLTAGLDSRTIFAAVRHVLPEENIHCFTFGYPGQFDTEFLARFGGFAKIHHFIDTCEIEWEVEREVDAARRSSRLRSYSAKTHLNRMLNAMGVPKHNFHGFMGDAVLGGSRPDGYTPIFDWTDAKARFLKKNDRWRLQFLLGEDEIEGLLPEAPEQLPAGFDYFDALDFGLRQHQRIGKDIVEKPHMLTPLADREWIGAQLAEPDLVKREKRYMRFLASFAPDVFPELVSEGIETRKQHLDYRRNFLQEIFDEHASAAATGGLRRGPSMPLTTSRGTMLAGRQFCERAEFDNNPSFNALVRELFFSFRARGILPAALLNAIWDSFINRHLAASERLRGLLNIEINIRAGKFGGTGATA